VCLDSHASSYVAGPNCLWRRLSRSVGAMERWRSHRTPQDNLRQKANEHEQFPIEEGHCPNHRRVWGIGAVYADVSQRRLRLVIVARDGETPGAGGAADKRDRTFIVAACPADLNDRGISAVVETSCGKIGHHLW